MTNSLRYTKAHRDELRIARRTAELAIRAELSDEAIVERVNDASLEPVIVDGVAHLGGGPVPLGEFLAAYRRGDLLLAH